MAKQGFTDKQKRKIEKMAKEGESFNDIVYSVTGNHKRYWEVYEHCWDSGCLSWVGAKRMIANRLKKLSGKRIPSEERKKIIREIKEYVDYLYYEGRNLQDKIKRIRKGVSVIKKAL